MWQDGLISHEERLAALLQLRLWDHAEEISLRALAENPNSPLAIYTRGMLALRARDYVTGERLFREALGINPDHRSSRYALAACSLVKGEFDKAEARVREVLEDEPDFIDGRIYLGWILAKSRQMTKAEDEVRRILELAPDDPAAFEIKLYLARSVQRTKDLSDLCRTLLSLDPNNCLARICLGEKYLANNKLDEAEQMFRECMELNPSAETENLLRITKWRRHRWGIFPLLVIWIRLKLRKLLFRNSIRKIGLAPRFNR